MKFKKGASNIVGVGTIIVIAVAIIFALSLMVGSGSIFSNIGQSTQKVSYVNNTVTFPAAGSTLTLNGQAVSDVIVTNKTSGAVVPSTNYTTTNYDVSTGTLRTYLTGLTGYYNNQSVNISYTTEPLGYATDSGSRAVIQLIGIFSALAVIGVIIWKIWDDGLLDSFK
jgi:hypothetical protein